MFITTYVLWSLRFFKLKTEGQTIYKLANIPKGNKT